MKQSHDILSIHDLMVKTTIGVYAWEKQVKQTLKINLDVACDVSKAALLDDISHAINYAEIASKVTSFIEQHHYQLLETLAERTAAYLLNNFQILWLSLSITKTGHIKNASGVTICIERSA